MNRGWKNNDSLFYNFWAETERSYLFWQFEREKLF